MYWILAIGIPSILILGGGMLAFAFSAEIPEAEEQPVIAAAEQAETSSGPLVFFQPMGWSANSSKATVEDIVSDIEAHLRKERQAASRFVSDPSQRNLYVD